MKAAQRRYVEANAIALLSNFERPEELDPALRRNGTEGRYGAALTLLANYTAGSFVAVANGHGGTGSHLHAASVVAAPPGLLESFVHLSDNGVHKALPCHQRY
jgi:hypothetical protein